MSEIQVAIDYCDREVEEESRARFLIKQLWACKADLTDYGMVAEYLGYDLDWAFANYEINRNFRNPMM